jgi:hypothetical protein
MVSGLLEGEGAWGVLSVVVSVLTLGAGVGTALAVASLWQLRRDVRVVKAAESFEAVDLTTVVKRYVPVEHQTNIVHEEIAVAKQTIAARQSRLKWMAVVFGMVSACGVAIATELSAPRHLQMIVTTWSTGRLRPPNLDPLRDIQGVWGWRADFLRSCSENPQTLRLAPDQKALTMRYAKPYNPGSGPVTEMTFDVVLVKRGKLVLLRTDSAAVGTPVPVDVLFIDANTMSWSAANSARGWSGSIERCALARQ